MAESLKQKTISGIIWSGVQKFGSLAISFLANIVLARLLSPEDFGCIGMLYIFIVVSQTFIDGGFGAALVQKKNPSEEDYSTIFYWNIIAAVLIYGVLYLSAPAIAGFYRIPLLCDVLRVQGLSLIISSTYIVQANRLIKHLKFKLYSQITIVAVLVGTVVGIGLAYYGWGVWSLVVKEMVTVLITGILLWILCHWKPLLKFSFTSFKSLFNYGFMILLASFVNRLYENVQGLIIGRAFSAKDLGYYTQAKKLEEIPVSAFSDMITQVTFPVYASIADQKEYLKTIVQKNVKVVNYISFGIMSLLIVIAKPVFVILFTEKWIDSVPLFQILCIAGMAIPLNNVSTQLFKGIGRSDIFFILQFVKRLIGLGIILFSIQWGLIAMMWAIVINGYLFYVLNCYYTSKVLKYSMKEQLMDILPNLLMAVILMFTLNYLSIWINSILKDWTLIFIDSIVFIGLYLCIGWLFKFEGLIILKQILKDKINR